MTAGASFTSNVILEQEYDEVSPDESIASAVKWAEKKISELERKFDWVFHGACEANPSLQRTSFGSR